MSNLEKHLTTSQECDILAEIYVKSNYADINSKRTVSKPDSKTYSIDLGVLQEYLALINDEMDKRGITDKGVKITLGKYPEVSKDVKLKPEYLGYQMIFFSPVDLGKSDMQNNPFQNELDSTSKLEDVSNLNYMNITPPF